MTDKTPNYSPAQEALILEAIRANDNVANLDVATTLAADERMNGADGPRKARAITAKMSRMKEQHGFTYERKAPVTKSGKPVTKKTDLVARIAELSGIAASKLEGLDSAPKAALDAIAERFAA